MSDPELSFCFSAQEEQKLRSAEIDSDLTRELLRNLKRQRLDSSQKNASFDILDIDGQRVLDVREKIEMHTNLDRSIAQLARYIPYHALQSTIVPSLRQHTVHNTVRWNRELLAEVGESLYPVCAYGMLNGGSATSYLDPIHNRRIHPSLFEKWQTVFQKVREQYVHLPKALCPALYNSDLTAGPTFMELRARHLVRATKRTRGQKDSVIPMFQMTSRSNHDMIVQATRDAFSRCAVGDKQEEMRRYYCDITKESRDVLCAPQPAIATFAYGGEAVFPLERTPPIFYPVPATEHQNHRAQRTSPAIPYGLPGGHGQALYVLRSILRTLFARGVRFVFLGNVDNLGYTINPVSLAYLVIQNGEALFEAVPRSAVDVKGGILVRRTSDGAICNAEIGASGVDMETITAYEAANKSVLFNCAIGLLDLERLLLKLDNYLERLPVHCLRKKTMRGEYWQLEQITWDLIGLIDAPYILVSNKTDRFLSAKLVFETLLLSGVPALSHADLSPIAEDLYRATKKLMSDAYGMQHQGGVWCARDT